MLKEIKKSGTKKYIPPDYIYMKSKIRQNKSMVIEI